MNIREFSKGDIIIRVKPAKSIGMTVTHMGAIPIPPCRSYMTEGYVFLGIANNIIYLRSTDEHTIKTFGADHLYKAELDLYEDGWEYYVDPSTLEDTFFTTKVLSQTSLKDLKKQLQEAIDKEDYLTASKLRDEIKKRQNEK